MATLKECEICGHQHYANKCPVDHNKLSKGLKYDQGKDRWDLLPFGTVKQIVKVLTFGALKYEDNSWQAVEKGRQRYYAAALRHLEAWWGGERKDPESGLHHLSHAACCMMFLIWLDDNEAKKPNIKPLDRRAKTTITSHNLSITNMTNKEQMEQEKYE